MAKLLVGSGDTDVSEKVIRRVQAEAEKILNKDEWIVIDGVKMWRG